ncbi:MAG: hypothetical protein HFI90_10810 [Clostridia bacterium]|nr:hypothetical protein [Clostridia bacterium]
MIKKTLTILSISVLSALGTVAAIGFIIYLLLPMNTCMPKNDIFDYVTQNQQALEAGIVDFMQHYPNVRDGDFKDKLQIPPSKGIKKITFSDNTIHFDCGGSGMGSATKYTGFYYLLPDKNVNISISQGVANMSALGYDNIKFMPEGNGWRYQETDGDNTVYIENIAGNFYYYFEEY